MSAHNEAFELFNAQAVTKDPGDAGHIVVSQSPSVCNMISLTAETRTLDRPTRAGAILTLHHLTDGGDITVTVTGNFSETGSSTLVFTDPGQIATLISLYDGTNYFWRVINNSAGAALTTQLTAITIADAAGTPDYALSALTTTSPFGLATAAEAITLLYVIQNLQVRMAEVEARLKAAGILKA